MEIKILELEEGKARISFPTETHTFMNAITDELLKDPKVDVATYTGTFTFTAPELLVTTHKKADPIEAIRRAATNISKVCEEMVAAIRAA